MFIPLLTHLEILGMRTDIAESFVEATRAAIFDSGEDAAMTLQSWGLDLTDIHEVTPW